MQFFKKKEKVSRSFKELGLCNELLDQLKIQGYTEPTDIQGLAIPVVLKGSDILARAQTGTGKTAAFTLPILQKLTDKGRRSGNAPRVLVLTPTRELAAQVGESVETYGKKMPLSSTVIFGGVGINPQIKRLKQGIDIVIGTPGRLLDLQNQRALDLSKIEILVLDEADRMLDMGFIHDIRKIIRLLPKQRQTLFFSATYSREIKALADRILYQPQSVEVAAQNSAAETVTQAVYYVEKAKKKDLLTHLILDGDWSQVLVFTKTKHGANKLAKQLDKEGITTAAIHGNKSQAARTRALKAFKDYDVQVLVATDIAARGIDIDQLPHVVNYELPNVPEDYVHRIGRTGRAGSSGESVSLISGDETRLLKAIERLLKNKITVKELKGFTVSPSNKQFFTETKKERPRDGYKGRKTSGYRGNQSRKKDGRKPRPRAS